MNPWLESLGVLLLSVAGAGAGAWFSRLPKPWWLLGYFMPLLAILAYGAARLEPSLALIPPVSWLMTGRVKFAAIGFLVAMVLTTPLVKLPRRRERLAVGLVIAVAVLAESVWPFLAPAFNRQALAGLVTFVDAQGVCLQRTDYTCGPAAAVTALRKLGFPAEEGRIAMLAHTTAATGTEPDVLAETLQQEYGPAGLVCEYRVFHDVSELRANTPTLAVIKFNWMVDHFVTVLGVAGTNVTVGDPLTGLTTLSAKEFQQKWRCTGVVLKRKPGA